MYLTIAECFARQRNTNASLDELNTLLEKRWRAGTFVPLVTSDATQALKWILTEHRKELPFRDLWSMDLKRLNKELGFETTLTRVLNGTVYALPPNDVKYALSIPEKVIELTGMEQTPT